MAVKLASSRRGGVQDLFHRRSSGGGSVSSRRSRSSKRSSNKNNRRGRQSSNSRRSRSRSRSRTRSSSKQRQRRHRDENDNTNNLIVNKSFEQKLTQDVESMSAQQKQQSRHPNSSSKRTKQHRRRHTADSTTTKSTKSSSTSAPTYCHDGIDLLFSDVISPLSGAICTFLTTCLCDDALIDGANDNRDDRHLHGLSSPNGVNRQIVNSRIPQRSRRDEKIKGSGNRRRVSPTVNGVVLKQ